MSRLSYSVRGAFFGAILAVGGTLRDRWGEVGTARGEYLDSAVLGVMVGALTGLTLHATRGMRRQRGLQYWLSWVISTNVGFSAAVLPALFATGDWLTALLFWPVMGTGSGLGLGAFQRTIGLGPPAH
ncbi:MAG: hypothetical protein RRA92_01440 [Gemmatimonadota bacterium]|nr:hypothetical protein [Gemmatimonadota bacterium]